MSRRSYEAELGLGAGRPAARAASGAVARSRLEAAVRSRVAQRFARLFREQNGVDPPPPGRRGMEGLERVIRYVASQHHPAHAAAWGALPEFSAPRDHGALASEREAIAGALVDWVAAHHFRRLAATDLWSDYWAAEYCKALAVRRLAEGGPGDWSGERHRDDPTGGW